jgi:hypothetical protein
MAAGTLAADRPGRSAVGHSIPKQIGRRRPFQMEYTPMPAPKAPRPPADYTQLVQRAVLHAQLLARLTEKFLAAASGFVAVETGKELWASLQEAATVLKRILPWWAITQPPDDPPAAVSYFQWVYRRGRGALAHAFAAAGALPEDWTRLGAGWEKARPFVIKYVPTVDGNWLDVRLLAEAQAPTPAQAPLAIYDHDTDYEIEAWEHWCDAASAVEAPKATKAWPFELTMDENERTARRGDESVAFGGNEKPWLVFTALLRRHPAHYKTPDLGRAVWNPDGKDCDPEDHVVHRTVSDLREYITPLGIVVKHIRGIGYQLIEKITPATPPTSAKRLARRGSSR